MTDERIRAAQSMLKNPIGSFVPLWDLAHYTAVKLPIKQEFYLTDY